MNAHACNESLIVLQDVSKRFGDNGNGRTAIDNVSLSCSSGELVLLLGPSGSGKTTLLTLMAGLIKPSKGRVLLFGREVQGYSEGELQHIRAHRLGFIFQNFLLIESLSVLENIVLVLGFAGITGSHAAEEARRLLRQFSIEHLSDASPPKLSQGEKQRVAIARAIANGGELIIADEPTASLESSQGLQVIELLRNLALSANRCVVVASHDQRLVEYADCVVRLRDGAIETVVRDSP